MTLTRLNREYFAWLTSQIGIHKNNKNTYDDLFAKMHDVEFIWTVPNDDNRVADGIEVRKEFLDSIIHRVDRVKVLETFFERGVSVLEVLIALSRRAEFIGSGAFPGSDDKLFWTWHLIENLGLHSFHDPLTNRNSEKVDEILDALVWRTYERDGRGGFFPLKNPKENQLEKEIWDQMNAYIIEKSRS